MKNLLVAIDFSDATDHLLATVADMARASGAKVWLMHCVDQHASIAGMNEVPMVLPVPESALPERFPAKYQQLTEVTRLLLNQGVQAEMLFVSGAITHEILVAAEDHKVDMIVIGSRGHGSLYDLVVGSITKSVLYYTNIPTLIVPCESHAEKEPVRADAWEEPMATPY